MRTAAITLTDSWFRLKRERQLILWCLIAMSLGFLSLFLKDMATGTSVESRDFFPLLIYAVCLLATLAFLVGSRFQGDQVLLGAFLFLGGFGIMAQYRMGGYRFEDFTELSQYGYPLGVLLMLITLGTFKAGRHQALSRFAIPVSVLALLLTAGVLVSGTRIRGAVFATGGVTPTELLKCLVVIFVAGNLAHHWKALQLKSGRTTPSLSKVLLPIGLFYLALGAMLVVQRDLGMLALVLCVAIVLLCAATGRLEYGIGGTVLAVMLSVLAYQFFLHGKQRFQTWLDPFQDPTGTGWQLLQGLSGMFAGGLWGTGLGQGNPERIPIAQSDFIYAVIGEEMGYIGCLLVVIFYLALFYRGLRIAARCQSEFSFLLVLGLVCVIAAQTFLNIAGVTKLLPLTGVPLPLISQGGSSIITISISVGLILAASDGQAKLKRKSPPEKNLPTPKHGNRRSGRIKKRVR